MTLNICKQEAVNNNLYTKSENPEISTQNKCPKHRLE